MCSDHPCCWCASFCVNALIFCHILQLMEESKLSAIIPCRNWSSLLEPYTFSRLPALKYLHRTLPFMTLWTSKSGLLPIACQNVLLRAAYLNFLLWVLMMSATYLGVQVCSEVLVSLPQTLLGESSLVWSCFKSRVKVIHSQQLLKYHRNLRCRCVARRSVVQWFKVQGIHLEGVITNL